MLVFPNCKINLGLKILFKRADGYHNLETVFYPVPLKDALEITSQPDNADDEIIFNASGLAIKGDSDNNLCIKAYQLLKKDYPTLPHIQLHLHKAIPMGAGLGGGSANAAFTLKLLNQKYQLQIPDTKLMEYALQLGSDCPFFIGNKPCIATGRGEVMTPVSLDLSAFTILLINPGIHINTGHAFEQLALQRSFLEPADIATTTSLSSIIQQPVLLWKTLLVNDFEVPVFAAHNILKELKETLYQYGAVYAAMSGSGSTIFGLFNKEQPMPALAFPPTYFVQNFPL